MKDAIALVETNETKAWNMKEFVDLLAEADIPTLDEKFSYKNIYIKHAGVTIGTMSISRKALVTLQ